MANDADVQGLAVIKGHGYEVVVTLGTGFGTAFFISGRLLPHMEFAHVDFAKERIVQRAPRRARSQEGRRQEVEQAGPQR